MANRLDCISSPTLRPAASYQGRLRHLARLRPRCRERFPGKLSDAYVLLESRIEVRHDAGVDGSGERVDDRVARQLCTDLRVGQVGCLPIGRRVPETTRQVAQQKRGWLSGRADVLGGVSRGSKYRSELGAVCLVDAHTYSWYNQ